MKYKKHLFLAAGLVGLSTFSVLSGRTTADTKKQQPLESLSETQQQAIARANDLSVAFQCIAEEVLPSVVAVESIKKSNLHYSSTKMPRGHLPNPPFNNQGKHPLDEMFEYLEPRLNPPERNAPNQNQLVNGIGTGVIIDSAGIIMTNHHVIANSDEVRIRTADGREFKAYEIQSDPKTDIAVLKIKDAKNLSAATLGDSDECGVGEWVLALGQPFGLENTVTAGIVSAKQRGIGIADRENFIQTDAAINPGNSGGPLVNLRGEVIGINTAIHSRSGGNNGIGFAVPSNLAKWVSSQLLNNGGVRRGYLGIAMQSLNPELAEHLHVGPRDGVVVTEVLPGSPADKSGIQVGDVITKFGSCSITNPKDLQLAVEQTKFGSNYNIRIMRNQELIDVVYVAEPHPEVDHSISQTKPSLDQTTMPSLLGMTFAQENNVSGIDQSNGIRITSVEEKSAAANAGIHPGMVLLEINQLKIRSVDDLIKIYQTSRKNGEISLMALVQFQETKRFLVLKIA